MVGICARVGGNTEKRPKKSIKSLSGGIPPPKSISSRAISFLFIYVY